MALGVANNVLKVCEMKASGEFKEFLIREEKIYVLRAFLCHGGFVYN